MKFLCDEMLVRLGRWLLAAGYDTEVAKSAESDRKILDKALKENRYLITRDRHFLEFQGVQDTVIWLESNTLEGCAQELSKKVQINWLYRPFSRCTLCNTELVVIEEDVLHDVPEGVLSEGKKFWRCEQCGRTYWDGTHTKRMLHQLKKWNKSGLL